VPGEFCPGDFTVNARGRVKLVGTAQRVVRRASLLAASIAVTGADSLRRVMVDVYAALELDMDPATVGAVDDEVPRTTVEGVERAVLAAYAERHDLTDAQLDPAALADAERLESRHAIQISSVTATGQ
jgi:octanoyl-[GcvH]:protein N-octanoyltransferase